MDITDTVFVLGNLIPKTYNKNHSNTLEVVMKLIKVFMSEEEIKK